MTPDELTLLKQYMHVDHNDDDVLIQRLWLDSNRYLKRGGAWTGVQDDAWYAAAALTLEKYDGTPLPDGARRVINQLKLEDPMF